MTSVALLLCFFFFNDTATTEIYTLSLHDALPICGRRDRPAHAVLGAHHHGGVLPALHLDRRRRREEREERDRKSTRLNSSHDQISYAVFCLKKKKNR